jgi:hypothetical protein
VRTTSERLSQKQQWFCLREISLLQSVEMHSTRKFRTVTLDLVNSRFPFLIHQHRTSRPRISNTLVQSLGFLGNNIGVLDLYSR